MIGLAAITADTSGSVVFEEDKANTSLRDPAARVSRKKTLDGGVYIDHSGVVDGDRTFTIAMPFSESQYTVVKRLQTNYTSIRISCREGCYKGTIEKLRLVDGRVDITILVEEKLSA